MRSSSTQPGRLSLALLHALLLPQLAGCGPASNGPDADANRGAVGLGPGLAGGAAPVPVVSTAPEGHPTPPGEPSDRTASGSPGAPAEPPGDAQPEPEADDSPIAVQTGQVDEPDAEDDTGPCPALPRALLTVEGAGSGALSGCVARTCAGVDLSGVDYDQLFEMPEVPLASYAGCTQIDGSLVVSLHAGDLHELSCLERVTGSVVIWRSPDLQSLDGLESLMQVDGDFELGQRESLSTGTYDMADFGPMLNLQVIGGRFGFAGGPGLQSFPEMPALRVVGGEVFFQFFYGAHDLAGLNALEHVGGAFNLWRPEGLERVTGLQSLTTINGFFVLWGATDMATLDGFPKLACIGGFVDIGGSASWENNAVLRRVNAFPALRTVGGDLLLEDNPALEAFEMFAAVESAGRLQVAANPQLVSLPLEGITSTLGLTFHDNPALSECPLRALATRLVLDPGLLDLEGNAACP